MMKIYLVGGAVRDQLLGLPIKEKDWVVVGATQHDMLQKGFRQVGKDFPVFLHPKTQEEYALARIERKIGKGYTGFAFETAPTVTLEEDLRRRDVTINAMAMAEDGTLIDPYHGEEDLRAGILRHVSSAFVEDPVRILRVARFAARFGFSVAPETLALMREIVTRDEVSALVAERVWKEFSRALIEPHPALFFKVLQACGALESLDFAAFSTAEALENVPAKIHFRFAVLSHAMRYEDLEKFCERYKVPSEVRDFARLINQFLPTYPHSSANAEDWLRYLMDLDAFRRESRFLDFIELSGYLNQDMTKLRDIYFVAKSVDISDVTREFQGKIIAEKIFEKRRKAIQNLL